MMIQWIFAAGMLLAQAALAGQVSVHDPVMEKHGDTYYLYSTGPGITFYSSKDMVSWRPEGRIFPGHPAAAKAAPGFDGHVWAPDIQHHDGKYLLYYSVSSFGKNTSAIGVAVNRTLDPRSPDYKWKDLGIVVQSVAGRDNWNAIDSNVVEDAEGTGWMVFGSFWGGIKMVKLNQDWTRPAEPQVWRTIAARARPAFTRDEDGGPAEIEGPFIFRKNGWYYLFVSWGLCCQKERSTYHVVVGRSPLATGPFVDKEGKDMAAGGGSVVVKGNGAWKALGHNSAYTFDGRDVLVLHAYETADKYLQKLKIMDIQWDGAGWPVVDTADLDRYKSVEQ